MRLTDIKVRSEKEEVRSERTKGRKYVQPLLQESDELVAIFTTSVKRLRLTLAAGAICLALAAAYSLSYFHFSVLTFSLCAAR
jgi:hypothetical protein